MSRKTVTVMISSRCSDKFPAGGKPLSNLRKRIKAEIEGERLFGEQLFEVWINEDAPPADTSQDSFDVCLKAVDDADIVLALANGNAGWAPRGSDVGICHAELMRAVNTAPAKVRLICLGSIPPASDKSQRDRDARLQSYLDTQNFFRGGSVKTVDDAVARCKEAVHDALTSLVHLGIREARKGKYHTGEALSWSKLSYSDRQQRSVNTIAAAFASNSGARREDNLVERPLAGETVLFAIHGVPSALTVAAGREMVGRPFLHDYQYAARLKSAVGPVHVIGCHKGATETQAANLLGFPDATIVGAPFGVYVADPIQLVQFAFLRECRDPSTTEFAVQRFFDWLAQSGEDKLIASRAASRARIVRAVSKEVS
jgi:hypothetical protein